ncbi:hypothetical protein [Actinotalea sp. C106]|uniref:hypothetical protein n=1 Tax=Actinotalea sp. C106 TaxID=2908644 RepID=UPI0020279715|nr:hypothetical protein [Actinotalea sp. C106]
MDPTEWRDTVLRHLPAITEAAAHAGATTVRLISPTPDRGALVILDVDHVADPALAAVHAAVKAALPEELIEVVAAGKDAAVITVNTKTGRVGRGDGTVDAPADGPLVRLTVRGPDAIRGAQRVLLEVEDHPAQGEDALRVQADDLTQVVRDLLSAVGALPARRATPASHGDIERQFEHFNFDTATTYVAGDPNTPPEILLTQALAARAYTERQARDGGGPS